MAIVFDKRVRATVDGEHIDRISEVCELAEYAIAEAREKRGRRDVQVASFYPENIKLIEAFIRYWQAHV